MKHNIFLLYEIIHDHTWLTIFILFFSVNDISILEDFSHCPNLQELYIRNNKIEDLRQICYLKDLEKLRILWLADNPCATADNYRYTVLRNLPGLQKLDNVGKAIPDPEVIKLFS